MQKKEKPTRHENGVNVYITKPFNKDIPYRVLTFDNTSNDNFQIVVEIKCRGEKSCCFYCDEIATENDTKFLKNLGAKETKAVIIMYHSLSSIFKFYYGFISLDEIGEENALIFNEKGEFANNEGCVII